MNQTHWDNAASIIRKLHQEFGDEKMLLARAAFIIFFQNDNEHFDHIQWRDGCFPDGVA